MPIRPENKDRYPKDWPAISAGIRIRADNRCEECSVENYQKGGRLKDGTWCPAQSTGTNGLGISWPREGEVAWCATPFGTAIRLRIVRIVLTVAHLNHKPEDCRPENLKCWCQRCHNKYDAAERARGIKERRRQKAATGDLFA